MSSAEEGATCGVPAGGSGGDRTEGGEAWELTYVWSSVEAAFQTLTASPSTRLQFTRLQRTLRRPTLLRRALG